jgi:hypothetical protein
VTVTVRWIPLVTAAYGTQVARPGRTTRLAPEGDGSQLDPRVRPVGGDDCLVGKPRRRRGSGFHLGYESLERRPEVLIWRRPGRSTWAFASLPTGNCPALFLPASDSLVNKP